MKNAPLKHLVLSGLIGLLPGIAAAVPIMDYFGPLNEATFGGTGIPNQEVAVASQFVDGNNLITVALSATQRYSNPPLTNDGAGTYFAGTGSNFGGNGESSFEGALWNFNYFIKVEGTNGATPKLTDYQFTLYYDFDPAFDNAIGTLGTIDLTAGVAASADPTATLAEDSQNLMFSYLAAGVPGFVIPPPAGSFDPNATGEYNFAIQVSNTLGFGVETVAMDVQVQTVPVPAAVWLFGSALGLLGWLRRKPA